MNDTVEGIEAHRLEELEKQAALHGPLTPPHILIEIQELKHKNRASSGMTRRQLVGGLDYDFLMNVVAAALVRLGQVETNQAKDLASRWLRQLIHDAWMLIMTVIVVFILILQLRGH